MKIPFTANGDEGEHEKWVYIFPHLNLEIGKTGEWSPFVIRAVHTPTRSSLLAVDAYCACVYIGPKHACMIDD